MKTWLMCRTRELSMSQTFKSVSLVSIMLLSVLSGMVVATDYAEANTVVITEPQQIVDGGSASDTQTAIVGDSQGNVHIIWARNSLHLYYSCLLYTSPSPRDNKASRMPSSA